MTRKALKTEKIEIRATRALKTLVREAARRDGFSSVSAWIERLIRRELGQQQGDDQP